MQEMSMAPKDKRPRNAAATRQDNPVMDCPPALIRPTNAAISVRPKRVGKSGAVYLSGLAEGTNVNVAALDSETYIVSSRPADELRILTANLPAAPVSPFAALSASISGRKHTAISPRVRGPYTGPIVLAITDGDEVELELARTKRRR
jgi:hypothetical protein